MNTFQVQVNSEIGELEGVILHSPGKEVENMTPENAERALYSDILNLSVAQKEYDVFKKSVEKHAPVFEVRDLLCEVLSNQRVKETLVDNIFEQETTLANKHVMLGLSDEELTRQLLEGVVMVKDNLTRYFSQDRYALRPLHNFFFTRDASMSIRDKVLIGRMANQVRGREAMIMQAIFDYHPMFATQTVNPVQHTSFNKNITIEGGDVLVAREDVLIIGTGLRTSSQGIDFILEQIESKEQIRHIIVQQLPESPESFIHLDMVFTFLDKHKCMVFEPVIMKSNSYQTVHITVDNGKVKIRNAKNIVECLNSLGFDVEPVYCGGTKDAWVQEREQWHSGANFFALAPGKIIGYSRNAYTMDELNQHGFEILQADKVALGKIDLAKYEKYVIAVDGSELPRGGGGARCMTMPFRRKNVEW